MLKVKELLKATKGSLLFGSSQAGISGFSIDSRSLRQGEAFIAIKGRNFDGHDFILQALNKGASCIIVEKKSALDLKSFNVACIKVESTLKALADLARYHRQKFAIPLIAITGSNGKTTTKELTSWLLSGRFKVLKNEGTKNNCIGLPMALLGLDSSYDLAVLEIGTNYFGEVANLARICLANIGVITNIAASHLEHLKDLAGVFREKYSLARNLKPPQLMLLNADDDNLRREILSGLRKPLIFGFGVENKSDFSISKIRHRGRNIEFYLKGCKVTLRTLARHNLSNALVAISLARIFGMGYPEIAQRLSGFEFPPGRFKVLKVNRIRFIDDTYNSNPFSLRQALESLAKLKVKGRKILVLGDMLELGRQRRSFHLQAGRYAAEACDKLLTVGRLSEFTAEAARACGFDIKNIYTCESSAEAREILFNKIYPGREDIVLVKGSRAMLMENVLKE